MTINMEIFFFADIMQSLIMSTGMDNSTSEEIRNPLALARPLVLVGLMGAGKTTIGKRLADRIGVRFVDSDHEIVEAAACSIPDIFEVYGEAIFRDLERRVLLRLLGEKPMVIATGGGAFMNPDIRAAISGRAVSIWLRADIEVLLERVCRRNNRPLLENGDKRAILDRLMHERSPTYALADMVVDNNLGHHEKVVVDIVELLQQLKEISI
jgi:shikimate kinase